MHACKHKVHSLGTIGAASNTNTSCISVFRTFDTDNSGFIDFKEFLLAINVTSSGTPERKLEWAFRMYDIDGNGTIDEREMIKIIEVCTCSLHAFAQAKVSECLGDLRNARPRSHAISRRLA